MFHFSCFKVTKFRVSSPSILLTALSSNKEAEGQRIKPICRTYPVLVQRNQEPLMYSSASNTLRRKHYTHPESSKVFCHKRKPFVTQLYFSSRERGFFFFPPVSHQFLPPNSQKRFSFFTKYSLRWKREFFYNQHGH